MAYQDIAQVCFLCDRGKL